jgi:acyl-CoA synthetase (AMP-forming)/AMP-acid ligase II
MALTESYVAGPAVPAVRDITLGRLLEQAAKSAPDRIALISGVPDPALRRQWTYAELYAEAQRTARALLSRFKPGERIAVWAQNLPEWIMLEFGAGLAGMVLVTVNPGFRAKEVEYVLKQSRSAGVFVANSFRGNPMLETVREVAPGCPELREIVCFDDWAAFIAAGDDNSIALPDVKPGDPVMIQYTSGTTGFPKGALLHHRGLANNGADTADRMGIDPGDVFITTMPLFHTGGCVCCVLGAVSKAATQVLLEAFEPGLVLELSDLPRQCDGRRADHAGGDAGASFLRIDRSFVGQGDLFGRLHRAGRAGCVVRTKTGSALHHRVRADGMFAGGGADQDHRHDRGQGLYHRPAAAQHGNQDRQSRHRQDGTDRRNRRVLHARLSHHARLFRNA